jgi:hypothetical protein
MKGPSPAAQRGPAAGRTVRFAIVAAFAQHGGTFERTTRPTPNRLNVSAFPLEPGPPPNFAPILQLWRRDTPEMPGFVRDHKCKIDAKGAARGGVRQRGEEMVRPASTGEDAGLADDFKALRGFAPAMKPVNPWNP